jgi:hypothetical protein
VRPGYKKESFKLVFNFYRLAAAVNEVFVGVLFGVNLAGR